METKQQLINSISEWVKMDNEMRKLKNEINIRKKNQKIISESLIDVMRKNEIDEFELKDGKIMYSKKNIKKPITKKMLLKIISNYFDGDITKAIELNNFILSNREEKEIETIVRTIYKS